MHGQEFLASFESPGGQKHSKHDLSAPILTHMKQSWEIVVLEGQMGTEFRNSTWVGEKKGRDFQQAHLGLIWTSERASKPAPK